MNNILESAKIPQEWQPNCHVTNDDMIYTPRFDDDGNMTATGAEAYAEYMAQQNEWASLTPQEEAQTQLAVLKAQLAATDYQAIKYAEGWLSAEEYAPIRIQRQVWRDEINRLEADLQLNAKSPSPAPS